MKKCSKCRKEKSFDNFYKRSRNPDGLRYTCKTCSQVKDKEWYKDNIEKTKARSKKWKENNPEEAKKIDKKWCKNNREKIKKTKKNWRKSNPEKIAEYKRRRRALKKDITENYTTEDRITTLNVFNNQCFLCKTADNLCIDHHRPLSKGNPLTPSNAVVLCRSCNSSKKNKNPEDFYGLNKCEELDILLSSLSYFI